MDTTRTTDRVTTREDLILAARENIQRQVHWLTDQPDGWIHRQRSGKHRILIRKEGTEIRMYYADPLHPESERMSGRMSELDLKDPLLLFVPYTQGMMLALLWRDQPRRVYTIGFGAGRVPTILHAYFPGLLLESTEIDEEVLSVAQKYFGYTPDKRQKVLIQDGREYLAATPPGTKYDFIHVDAFQGFGHSPLLLATQEFYDLCRQHLVEGGVVCVNLVVSDPLFKARIKTAEASFKNVYLFIHEDATVLYGTDAPHLDQEEIRARAEAVQARCHFGFPLVELAGKLKHVDDHAAYLQRFEDSGSPLTDRNPPAALSAIPKADPIFYNVSRNAPCPCGSGKKFKKCHMQ